MVFWRGLTRGFVVWWRGKTTMDFDVVMCVRLIILVVIAKTGCSQKPEFIGPVPNITVAIGRQATLTCGVNNLGEYKVAWVKVDTQTILSIHQYVITRNYRITLTHNDGKFWNLHIKDVQEGDRGYYMCQINTIPMKHQKGYLDITYPPNIIDSETSNDVTVKEGENVSLACRAEGRPRPHIIWRREDGKAIFSGSVEATTIDGEELKFTRVSRLHMAFYLCIANNGVPPSVSKRIHLQVHFPPYTWIPNQLVGGYLGGEVTLECNTEAFPKSINYWTTEDGDMITAGEKYETLLIDDVYVVFMKLTIRNLETKDFRMYRCIARNFLGETDGSINLYEIPSPILPPSATTEKINFETKDHIQDSKDSFQIANPFPTLDEGSEDPMMPDPINVGKSKDAALLRPTNQLPQDNSGHIFKCSLWNISILSILTNYFNFL